MSAPRFLDLSLLQGIGTVLGHAAWWLPSRAKSVTRANLRHCFAGIDRKQQDECGQASARASGCLLLESVVLWAGYRRVHRWIVEVSGREILDEALAAGRGVVCLVPHFGNWELLNYYLARHYEFSALYAPRRNRWLERFVKRGRSWAGARMQPIGTRGVRALHDALRHNEVVGVMPDQVADGNGAVTATFFGQPARTSTLGIRLAMRSSATVVVASAQRLATGSGFAVRFERLPWSRDGESEVLMEGIDALQRAIETVVRRDLAQYQWSYKRFKHAVPGIDIYKATSSPGST